MNATSFEHHVRFGMHAERTMDHNLAAELFYLLQDITKDDPSLNALTVEQLKWRASHIAFSAVRDGKSIDPSVIDHANSRSKYGPQHGT